MDTWKIADIEKILSSQISKNTISTGWDVATHHTGVCRLETDNDTIYLKELFKIDDVSKDDIKNRMDYFLDKVKALRTEWLKKKSTKRNIVVIEDTWLGPDFDGVKKLIRFGALLYVRFRKYSDYLFFIMPVSARSRIKFNKKDQMANTKIKVACYTRDTKDAQGKLKHKKGEAKPIDIKLLVEEYVNNIFKLALDDSDKCDAFVLAICGLIK